jgi:hypothetical protein
VVAAVVVGAEVPAVVAAAAVGAEVPAVVVAAAVGVEIPASVDADVASGGTQKESQLAAEPDVAELLGAAVTMHPTVVHHQHVAVSKTVHLHHRYASVDLLNWQVL